MREELLDRLSYIVQILGSAHPKELTYAELARRITEITRDREPTKRTLLRDIERLQRQGFDIHAVQRGRYTMLSLAPDEQRQSIPISDIQLLALSLAQELLEPLRGTVFWNGMRTLWNEAMRNAPENTQRHFERRRRHVIVRGSPAKSYADKGGILSTLFEAQLSHREVEIVYATPGKAINKTPARTVRPYTMAFYHGSIFIVAQDAAKESFRMFKLDRIAKAKRLDTYFQPSADFDPSEYFQHSMSVYAGGEETPCRMVLRIDRKVSAHIAEQPWHPEQTLEERKDGDFLLTLPSVFESEVIKRALGYRDQVEILEPKSARKRMRETLSDVAKLYE